MGDVTTLMSVARLSFRPSGKVDWIKNRICVSSVGSVNKELNGGCSLCPD